MLLKAERGDECKIAVVLRVAEWPLLLLILVVELGVERRLTRRTTGGEFL